jgi:uncharacterized membrane protein YphA (DoxX/SURF4 family)
MQILVLFALFVVGLNAIAVGICTLIEAYSEYASLLAFLGLFVGNFIVAWQLALHITERYLVSPAQKKKNEEHTRWVNSLYLRMRA